MYCVYNSASFKLHDYTSYCFSETSFIISSFYIFNFCIWFLYSALRLVSLMISCFKLLIVSVLEPTTFINSAISRLFASIVNYNSVAWFKRSIFWLYIFYYIETRFLLSYINYSFKVLVEVKSVLHVFILVWRSATFYWYERFSELHASNPDLVVVNSYISLSFSDYSYAIVVCKTAIYYVKSVACIYILFY